MKLRLPFILILLVAKASFFIYGETFKDIPIEHRLMIEQHPYQVLGSGAACLDLLIPVNDEFLSNVPGQKGGAEVIGIDQLNGIIQESGVQPYIATGGSCANAIKGLAKLGIPCGFMSRIGKDALGHYFRDYMQKMGVVPLFIESNLPSTRVLCLITPDGQRTMRFFEGCSKEISDKDLHPDYLKGVKILHLDAYGLRNGNVLKKLMQMAKAAGTQVSLDLSSFEIVHQYKKTIQDLLENYVDIVFGNEDEVKALTGLGPYEACQYLQSICPIAVILMGKEGCLVGHQNEIFQSPAFPAKVIDTTGAGDLFASGFLYGYIGNYPLKSCARFGNLLGGAIIEVTGAELPEERWRTIKEAISKEKIN